MGNNRIGGNDSLSATLRTAASAKVTAPPDIGPSIIGAITRADAVRLRIRSAGAIALAFSLLWAARRCAAHRTTPPGSN